METLIQLSGVVRADVVLTDPASGLLVGENDLVFNASKITYMDNVLESIIFVAQKGHKRTPARTAKLRTHDLPGRIYYCSKCGWLTDCKKPCRNCSEGQAVISEITQKAQEEKVPPKIPNKFLLDLQEPDPYNPLAAWINPNSTLYAEA
jgi:hypothetical protein